MARALRSYLPGYCWHLTHRCHRREFLLSSDDDRERWIFWLSRARDRFGLTILDYVVTSNHIHLMVLDSGVARAISRSMHLMEGRTAQEYNLKEDRHGAFWEDRYHAAAVENGSHLISAVVYIDLNMVRAGVVDHPASWRFSGYTEIQGDCGRRSLIDLDALKKLWGTDDISRLRNEHKSLIEQALIRGSVRDPKWTEGLAIGSESFVESMKTQLKFRTKKRFIHQDGPHFYLR